MRRDLRALADDLLSQASLRNRGLFEPAAVEKLRRMNDEGRKDAAYTLFSLMCLELWCRHFVDGRPASRLSPGPQGA